MGDPTIDGDSAPLVLITGGTGHLGCRVIVEALVAGYSVRAAIRSEGKAANVLATPSIRSINPGSRLSFAKVADMAALGVYDEAVKGCDYIIHVASPMGRSGSTDYETDLIQPTLSGTVGMLESAAKTDTVKRVVITSSAIALVSFGYLAGPESDKIIKASDRTGDVGGPFPYGMMQAYHAAKVCSLNATEYWMKDKRPRFDLVTLIPSQILGKNELVTDLQDILKDSNHNVLDAIVGIKASQPKPGTTVLLDDTAKLHVRALDTDKIPGNSAFILNSNGLEGTTLNDALEIVARRFPDAVKDGSLKNDGDSPTKHYKLDGGPTEETFGFSFAPFEDQVVSVVQHYIQLAAAV